MRAHEAARAVTKRGAFGQIGRLVGAIGGHAADVLGRAAGLGEHGENVFESLLELGDKFVALEPLRRVPAHLACDEYDAPGRRLDPVGISDRRRPPGGKQNAHRHGVLLNAVVSARRRRKFSFPRTWAAACSRSPDRRARSPWSACRWLALAPRPRWRHRCPCSIPGGCTSWSWREQRSARRRATSPPPARRRA